MHMADRVHTLWQLEGVVEGEEIAISMTGVETVLPVKLAARLQSAASLQAEHNLCLHQIPCKQAATEGAFNLKPCSAFAIVAAQEWKTECLLCHS